MRTEAPARTASEQLFEELLDRVRPVMAQTVDALQVAALLEADGITDAGAQKLYGFDDVFHLATEVRSRSVAAPPVAVHFGEVDGGLVGRVRRPTRRTLGPRLGKLPRTGPPAPAEVSASRLLSHGALYLLPAALFPPVLVVLGSGSLIMGLVIGGALAWVWAGAATWVAYQLLSARKPDAASRVLRLASMSGLVVAGATGLAVAGATGHGPAIAAVGTGQMAYQMGATVLMFHRREELLVLAMIPAVVVGATYLVSDAVVSTTMTLVVGGLSVLAVLALSFVVRRKSGDHAAAAAWTAVHGDPRQFALVVVYTGLTAAYLIHAQLRYMTGSVDVALGLVPLVVGMGVVELRANRFRARAGSLLRSVSYPREFASGVRWILFLDMVIVVVAVTGLGVLVLGALALRGDLTRAAVVMAAAGALLASAYYLSFLMTGMAMLGPLCVAVGLALGIHVIAGATVPASRAPLADTSIFVATTLLLLTVSLLAILPSITDPRAHQ